MSLWFTILILPGRRRCHDHSGMDAYANARCGGAIDAPWSHPRTARPVASHRRRACPRSVEPERRSRREDFAVRAIFGSAHRRRAKSDSAYAGAMMTSLGLSHQSRRWVADAGEAGIGGGGLVWAKASALESPKDGSNAS